MRSYQEIILEAKKSTPTGTRWVTIRGAKVLVKGKSGIPVGKGAAAKGISAHRSKIARGIRTERTTPKYSEKDYRLIKSDYSAAKENLTAAQKEYDDAKSKYSKTGNALYKVHMDFNKATLDKAKQAIAPVEKKYRAVKSQFDKAEAERQAKIVRPSTTDRTYRADKGTDSRDATLAKVKTIDPIKVDKDPSGEASYKNSLTYHKKYEGHLEQYRDSVLKFTGGESEDMRALDAGRSTSTDRRNQIHVDKVNKYLAESPKHEGVVYRGLGDKSGAFDGVKPGQVIKNEAMSSWSRDPRVGVAYADKSETTPTLFVMKATGKSGVVLPSDKGHNTFGKETPIGSKGTWVHHRSESEVLFSKKAKYKVTGVSENSGRRMIFVEEI